MLLVEKPSYDGHEFEFVQPGRRPARRPRDPDHRLPRHAFVRPRVRGLLRARRERHRRRRRPRQGLLLHDGRHDGRAHADRGARLRRDARRAARRDPLRRRPQGVRRAAGRLPADRARSSRGWRRAMPACRQLAYARRRACSTAAAGAWKPASSSCSPAARPRSSRARRCRSTAAWAMPRRSPVSRYFVDARVLSIFEGAEETLALKVVARSLLEDALAAADAQERAPADDRRADPRRPARGREPRPSSPRRSAA